MSALRLGDRVRHVTYGTIGRVTESPAAMAGVPMAGWVRVSPEKPDAYSADSLAGEHMFERIGGGK